ncbi:MAG: hypothetical protein IT186_21435 [Acidobacteria bacterium]|nr:hypothetical protein [Acidobacteriota bacterium]
MGLYGRVRTLRPGDEFQLRAVIRTSLGNYHAIIAVESYDPYLGRYTTPESTCYRLPLEMIEELT